MKQLPYYPSSKKDGLKEFKRKGWMLIDATYQPVDKRKDRNDIIERDYFKLRHDRSSLLQDRSTPVILIKANVCQILGRKLLKDGFNVLNNDNDPVPFPSHSHQIRFGKMFGALLRLHRLHASGS